MANSSLSLISLDFDSLKSNLKTYLQSQSIFKDYDYDSSNMNVLLDVLSYNSYLNSFYVNMLAAESFLDSAQLRSSVVSHAKSLNYTPRSKRSSSAYIDIEFNTSGITSGIFEIPKGTQFSGYNANGSYTFVTDSSHVSYSTGNTFTFSNVAIFEGSYINESYIVDNTIDNQRFVISNANVDTTSVSVTVADAGGVQTYEYTKADTLFGLNNTSNVYFIQATLDNSYEIVFGDGIFGNVPANGTTILAVYRVTKGDSANGIKKFGMDKDLGPYNGGIASPVVTVLAPSAEGALEEDIESIRFRAPRHYQTQDRAITPSDYRNLVLENYPEVKAVNVYGGETVSGSVEYGRVFISPITYSGSLIPESRKNEIISYLSTKSAIGLTPVMVDPDILYVCLDIKADVDFNATNKSPTDMVTLLTNAASNFNTTYLEDFNTAFRFSNFSTALNSCDSAVVSVQVSNYVKKILSPELNTSSALSLSFNNELIPGSIYSTQFVLNDGKVYNFTDFNPDNNTFSRSSQQSGVEITNTSKILYLYESGSVNTKSYSQAGTIDYANGIISIKNINVVDFLNSTGIEIFAFTKADDIFAKKNDLIEIDFNNFTVSVEQA